PARSSRTWPPPSPGRDPAERGRPTTSARTGWLPTRRPPPRARRAATPGHPPRIRRRPGRHARNRFSSTRSRHAGCPGSTHTTSGWKDNMRTVTDVPSVARAVTADVPVFELAAPCAVFGRARERWVDPWYEFTVCAPANVRFGGWFRVATTHRL